MKTTTLAAAILAASVLCAQAGTEIITNYFATYRLVSSTTTNAGDTGLTTNTAYACFPLSLLVDCTETNASHTNAASNIRALMYSLLAQYQTAYTAAGTNASASRVLTSATYTQGTNVVTVKTIHTLETTRSASTASPSYP